MYELAAMRADDQHHPQAAVEYYRRVLSLLANMPHYRDWRLHVEQRLGRVLKRQGRLVEAARTFQAMQEAAELEGNLPLQATAEMELAGIYREQGRYGAMLECVARAERLAWLVGANSELHRALSDKAAAHLLLGQPEEAVEAIQQALELATLLETPAALSLSLSQAAAAWQAIGDSAQAIHFLAQLAEQAERLRDAGQLHDAAYAFRLLGQEQLHTDQRAGRSSLQQALDHYRSAAAQIATSDTLAVLARTACLAGEAEQAISHCREALLIAEATGNEYGKLHYLLALGRALLAAGQHKEARQTLQQVLATAGDETRFGRWYLLDEAQALLQEVEERATNAREMA
jgi:tetratricopeptide (TPR) repeat protein